MTPVVSDKEMSLENKIIATLNGEGFIASVGPDGITIMERAGFNFPQVCYLNIAPYDVDSKTWTLRAAKPEYNETVQLLAGVLSELYGENVQCELKQEPVTAK